MKAWSGRTKTTRSTLRFQTSSRWLQPTDVGAANLQIVPGRTNGMPLEVNFPFRLRSARYPTKYLGGTSQGDVFLTTSATAAEIRFNGPMLPL